MPDPKRCASKFPTGSKAYNDCVNYKKGALPSSEESTFKDNEGNPLPGQRSKPRQGMRKRRGY